MKGPNLNVPSLKFCTVCEKPRPLSQFRPNRNHPEKLSDRCDVCVTEYRHSRRMNRAGRLMRHSVVAADTARSIRERPQGHPLGTIAEPLPMLEAKGHSVAPWRWDAAAEGLVPA